ncbi:hypothetical protein [Dyella nitratireducens]|uniref:Uncharacterized protein n=1 Tax=Dyella nitratireducens TaxID=1849580 RepID=A0ABQ1FSR7_9GAMM|nr:hypothetical protein [Dyella nitratireducens]GGA28686.1 hypothetical protein GCM10010981_16870 [Dyella nitratireducens]GLQ43248.1 hypothetical protein GCM10007902_30980 [Dyella nitratireducens]
MPATNRPLDEVDAQLLSACHSLGALADHIATHGLQEQLLINLERVAIGFRRLLVERCATMAAMKVTCAPEVL